jgi:hypothetical protein
MPTTAKIKQEVLKIARVFQRTDFESGIPVAPKITELTHQTGVYAIKHRDLSVLWVKRIACAPDFSRVTTPCCGFH